MLPEQLQPLIETMDIEDHGEVGNVLKSNINTYIQALTRSEYIIVNITASMIMQYKQKLEVINLLSIDSDVGHDLSTMNRSLSESIDDLLSNTDAELKDTVSDQE